MPEQITEDVVSELVRTLVRQARRTAPNRLDPAFEEWLSGYSEGIEHALETLRLRSSTRAEVAADELLKLRRLVRDFTDPDPCSFDHHGGCQAHGYLCLEPGELCPHEEARRYLAEVADASR